MRSERAPSAVAEFSSAVGRADNVGQENGRQVELPRPFPYPSGHVEEREHAVEREEKDVKQLQHR